MKALFFSLLVLVFGLSACVQQTQPQATEPTSEQSQPTPANNNTESNGAASAEASSRADEPAATKPKGTIYRLDGRFNGIPSEWLQVDFDSQKNKINGIWYWNTQNEKRVAIKILEQNFASGEISGYTGKLEFPDNGGKYEFGIIEGNFNLIDGDAMHEFEFESRG